MMQDWDIKDYLLSIGHKPIRGDSGKYTFYISPLRHENNASLIVRNTDSRWSDPGYKNTIPERVGKKWGSIIDLVREINKCDYKTAVNTLNETSVKTGSTTKFIEDKPSIEIVSEKEISNKSLIYYLKSRRINVDTAKDCCRELSVRFPNSEKHSDTIYFYIGFKTNKGSWELRSSGMKISTPPKYYTKIDGDPTKIYLFEGFFDYLSALTYYGVKRFKATVIVLNSLVNIAYVKDLLVNSDIVYSFLDNDEPADAAIDELIHEGANVDDVRKGLYLNYNDFNDFICGKKCKVIQ